MTRDTVPARAVVYAGAAERLVAYLVDGVIIGILTFIAVYISTRVFGPTLRIVTVDGLPRVTVDGTRVVINAAVAMLITGCYFVGGWSLLGATPGQRILGLRVLRFEGAHRLGVGQSLLRWLVMGAPFGLLSAIVLPLPLVAAALGVVIAIWYLILLGSTARGDRNRGLHDRAAGSVVVRDAALAEAIGEI